jgi:hypothetical protein
MGGLLTIHAGEAEAQKHKAENYFSNFTHFKHAHMIFRPCKRIFLSLLSFNVITTTLHPFPLITLHCLPFPLISYIKSYVRPQKQMERYASIYAFVKNFVKCDSISTIRWSGWQRTNAARRFVDASALFDLRSP